MVPSQYELAAKQTLVHIACLQLWCAYISRSIRTIAAKAGSIPEDQIWHVHIQQGGRVRADFKRRASLWEKGYVGRRFLHCICICLYMSMASFLDVCVWCTCAHYMLPSHQGHLYIATLYSTVSDPRTRPPLSSTLFLIQNKWSQESTGRRWEGWREGFDGMTEKGKEIQSIITLAKHQELKKRERERKKRRSMGKFIFPSATINLWPKEIHNN